HCPVRFPGISSSYARAARHAHPSPFEVLHPHRRSSARMVTLLVELSCKYLTVHARAHPAVTHQYASWRGATRTEQRDPSLIRRRAAPAWCQRQHLRQRLRDWQERPLDPVALQALLPAWGERHDSGVVLKQLLAIDVRAAVYERMIPRQR